MISILRARTWTSGHIINMTRCPFRLYDDSTGEIVTFYPNARSFCTRRTMSLFPVDAYYVFTDDMVEDIRWFQNYCGHVAIIDGVSHGRGGVDIVRLESADHRELIRFRRKEY